MRLILRQPKEQKSDFDRFLSVMKDLVFPVATVCIAYLVYSQNRAYQMTTQRLELQTTAASLADNRAKVLTDLWEPDENKRTLAAIRLALDGEHSLPLIREALGVVESRVRNGAVRVIVQMLQTETIPRATLLKQLMDYYTSGSSTTRVGILQSLVSADRYLTDAEARSVLDELVKDRSAHQRGCDIGAGDADISLAQFVGLWGSRDEISLLFEMASACGDLQVYQEARNQAVNELPHVAERVSLDERKQMVEDLRILGRTANPVTQAKINDAIFHVGTPTHR